MAKKDKDTGLTDREKLFGLEYLKDMNATQAAIRAGYSKKTARQIGTENLSKPDIILFMNEAKDKMFEKAGIDGQYVIDNLKELSDICMGRKPIVTKIKKGRKEYIETRTIFDASGAISANEKLGKYHKLFTDRVEHVGKVKTIAMTKEEAEEFDKLVEEN